jgi:hypothetical protein
VKLYARVALGIGAFLFVAGLVYNLLYKERIGGVELLIAAGGFAYLGIYANRAVRSATRALQRDQAAGEGAALPLEEPEVRPTIWPLVFALAGAGLVVGVLATHWLLILATLLFLAAAAGWFREILTQRTHSHHAE